MKGAVIWKVMAILVLHRALTTTSVAADLPPETLQRIEREFSYRCWTEITAEKFVKEVGPSAVPVLIGMLQAPPEPGVKGKIAAYLGKFGDESATDPIIQQIEAKMPDVLDRCTDGQMHGLFYGLAWLGNDKAISFVRKAMTESYWEAREDRPIALCGIDEIPPGIDRSFYVHLTRSSFIKCAFYAFAHSGTPQARQAFSSGEGFPPNIPDNLIKNAREDAILRADGKVEEIRKKWSKIMGP